MVYILSIVFDGLKACPGPKQANLALLFSTRDYSERDDWPSTHPAREFWQAPDSQE